MSVDPLKSNALSLDGVHILASHSLVDGTEEANRVPEGAVPPERMLEVLRRLDQGHYSSFEVQDKVAHAVLQDLRLSRTE
jgi:hypothetical protein